MPVDAVVGRDTLIAELTRQSEVEKKMAAQLKSLTHGQSIAAIARMQSESAAALVRAEQLRRKAAAVQARK